MADREEQQIAVTDHQNKEVQPPAEMAAVREQMEVTASNGGIRTHGRKQLGKLKLSFGVPNRAFTPRMNLQLSISQG